MKILVAVKEVTSVDDEFSIADNEIDEAYRTYDLNEWDSYALEEAVQIGEETDDAEVVTVTIGPERSEETIRQALAKGADRAIRIWDETLTGDRLLDVHAKAELLSAVVEDEAADLVMTGVQAADDTFSATGVALARRHGYQWAAVVNALELNPEDRTASVHRELEGGLIERTEITLPAVLTIQTGINDPRYASLRGIRQAQSKPLDVRTPADLGVSLKGTDDLTLEAMYEPESETDVEYFEGGAEEQAARLADLLADKEVVSS